MEKRRKTRREKRDERTRRHEKWLETVHRIAHCGQLEAACSHQFWCGFVVI